MAAFLLFAFVLSGCGAKTGLLVPTVVSAADVVDVPDATDVRDVSDACMTATDQCGPTEICGNGADDNCDGHVDEGCPCAPGAVQSCFAGPPGRRNVGACQDGAQTCRMTRLWGDCTGGIVPRADVCNGEDNLCNGCSARTNCPVTCPAPGDVRVPTGRPFDEYPLRGELFYPGMARSWAWDVQGGPCDAISVAKSFTVRDAHRQDATLIPLLSGDYTVTVTIVTADGQTLVCTFIVHILGPGLRIEMCYPENTTVDLDMLIHRPQGPPQSVWYQRNSIGQYDVNYPVYDWTCGWANCEAVIRGQTETMPPVTYPRADWGYATTPLINCQNGPHGEEWLLLGGCSNPRLDIDNNLEKATGRPENINIDAPPEGQTYRVMVQDFSGLPAHPLVNIYCNGTRVATYGQPPDDFVLNGAPRPAIGAMWRATDVTTHIAPDGTTRCDTTLLHTPGLGNGYYVTQGDPIY